MATAYPCDAKNRAESSPFGFAPLLEGVLMRIVGSVPLTSVGRYRSVASLTPSRIGTMTCRSMVTSCVPWGRGYGAPAGGCATLGALIAETASIEKTAVRAVRMDNGFEDEVRVSIATRTNDVDEITSGAIFGNPSGARRYAGDPRGRRAHALTAPHHRPAVTCAERECAHPPRASPPGRDAERAGVTRQPP